MLREQKTQFVDMMRGEIESAAGVLFLDFTGLKVNDANELRKKLRESEIGYHVVKNTLMSRAMEGTSYADAAKLLKGTPTGVIIGREDPVAAAKVAFEFIKGRQNLKIKGGVLDKKAIGPKEAETLSKMPGRQELLGIVVAQFMSPATDLIRQLKGPAGRIVGALDKKAESESEG